MHGWIGRDRGDEPGSAADFDFAERRRLDDHDLLQADQLEQRQKRHHDLGAAGGFLEQLGKLQRRPAGHGPAQQVDFFADRPLVFKDVASVFVLLKTFEDVAYRIDEVEERNRGTRRRCG